MAEWWGGCSVLGSVSLGTALSYLQVPVRKYCFKMFHLNVHTL